MNPAASTPGTARFGPYEVDTRTGELRKFGTRIKLGEQPFCILLMLIEHPGDVVTREEIRSKLWSHDTFVDFDHSLNSAVQRLRDVLSDTAQKAQWIETVPRRGYRFVAEVQWTRPETKPNANGDSFDKVDNTDRDAAAVLSPTFPHQVQHPVQQPTPWRHHQGLIFASLILLLAAGAAAKIALGRRTDKQRMVIRSLAILPLQNLSGDASQGYLADGMTDELITALAKNRSLRIVSRTSAMQYKGASRPIKEIAQELGVDGIVEGSMMRSGDHVHMTVQLIYAPTDTHLWAESYDRDLSGALALSFELSQTIAREIKVAVSPSGPQRYVNPEAHDAYLRGRYLWYFWFSNKEPSLGYFQKAVQLQPDYAAAWSGLSDYYGARSVSGAVPPQAVSQDWEKDAYKAVELDDSLAEGHNSLAAWYLFSAWDWKRAEAESLRAIALNPNYAEAYHVYCYILTVTNRPAEAIRIQQLGMEADPFGRTWALGLAYYNLRQFDAAINELRVREQAEPSAVTIHSILSDTYKLNGMEKEAAYELEQVYRLEGNNASVAAIEQAFKHGGYNSVARWRLNQQKASAHRQYLSPYWRALETARAQQKEETLQSLEDAFREHSPRLVFLQSEPLFDFLHQEPRYQALVKKVGLPIAP